MDKGQDDSSMKDMAELESILKIRGIAIRMLVEWSRIMVRRSPGI